MARVIDPRNVQALESVITVARLKESRLLKLLQQADSRLVEQQQLLATLQEYGVECREKISAMDGAGQPLGSDSLLQRKNLLAMIQQVESMKAIQAIQVKNAESERLRIRHAFQKAHLYLENLQQLQARNKSALQQQHIKRQEKSSYDEYLTRFSTPQPRASGRPLAAEKIEISAKVT